MEGLFSNTGKLMADVFSLGWNSNLQDTGPAGLELKSPDIWCCRDEHFCKLAFVSQCNQPVCIEYFAEMHLTFLLFQECQDHTVGDFCEQCEDRYLPVSLPDGTFVCRPCACPLSFESNK